MRLIREVSVGGMARFEVGATGKAAGEGGEGRVGRGGYSHLMGSLWLGKSIKMLARSPATNALTFCLSSPAF
jgi:hypothetical protein